MRKKVSSITLLAGILLILVLWGTAAQSATIYVPDNYATIQEAVGAANGGDTIIVRVGTHIIASKLTVPEQIILTFAPGVVVKFGGGCWLRVYGDLIAEGTSDAPIVFTSIKDDFYGGDTNDDEDATTPAKNDWGNILFWDTSDGSILDHVVVKYGGQTYSFPMWQSLPAIHVFTSNLVVSNSTITENGNYGIYVVDASPTILENVITNNSKSGIRLLNASPQIAGNTITGAGQSGISATNSNPIIENNGIGNNAGWAIGLDPSSSGASIQGNALFGSNAGIFVGAGDLETSVTWNSDSVYVIDFYRSQTHNLTVNEGAILTIEPGVVVKFEKSARLFVKGDLIAEGTPEAQIVFTSLKDDSHGGDTNGDGSLTAPGKNDWGNIVLWYTSQQSVLDHTVVMYAGQTWSWPLYQSCPAIHVFTPNLVVSNSTITENGVDGIYAFPHVQSNIVIEGNIISKNGRDGIRLYNASARVVGNKLAENSYGIYLTGSPGSEVYLNNFVDNYRHALSTDSVCFWHSDRRSYTYNGNTYTNYLGNYWDDYAGTDAAGDGIGDIPYSIDSDQDSYPLMMPFENYEIGGEEPPEMPVKGIDVSSYQGDIDWSEVYNADYRFAFVKASEGEGWTGDSAAKDDYFEENMINARSAGILVGAYHFGLPQYNSPSEEASWFLEVVSENLKSGDLRPVFDLENHEHTGTVPSSLNSLDHPENLTKWILTWMNIVEESIGVEPVLYTTRSYASDELVHNIMPFGKSIIDYDLWIAKPTNNLDEPPTSEECGIWDDWDFWQYSWQGSVPGINGNVDLDLFNGDMSTLNSFTIPALKWEPLSWIVFRLLSPADIIVTDPDGLGISKQLNEITEAVFLEYDINADGELDEIIDIFKRKIGDYQITVVPKMTASLEDTYCLKITTYGDTVVLAEDVAIKDIPTQPYIIRSTEDVIIPIIPATIDFDSDTLNLKSEGKWITVYIELTVGHGYDVSDINLARTFLEGLLEVQHSDVQDGVLMVKFDRQDLIIFLESVVGVIPPDDVPLTVTGELKDGRRFEGSDIVRVIKEGGKK